MSPRRRGNENLSVDKLASGALPELDAAQIEYFADMAFDDRLLTILERESKTIAIDTVGNTTQLVGEGFFEANSLVYETVQLSEDGPLDELPLGSFSYRAKGTIVEQPGKLEIDLRISADIDDQPAMYVQSDPKNRDGFFVYRDGLIDEPSYVSTVELSQLVMMLGGLDAASRKQLRKGIGNKPAAYRPLITQLLKNIGERAGEMTESTFLIINLPASTDERPQRGKLAYVTRETPIESTVTMTLQNVTDYPELDSQEAYTLRLAYANAGHTNLEKDAKKVISSGIAPPTLRGIEMSHEATGVRPHKLDINDPTVQQLFVDTFDQIVTN